MPARYELLERWVNENGWTIGVELGVFDGRTFLHLLQNCRDLTLYGVDVWGRFTPQGATTSGERCFCPYCSETRASRKSRSIDQMERAVKGAVVAIDPDRGKLLTLATSDAVRMFADGTLDFVFVDADHSTEGVARDIREWAPKLKPWGWLIGHDYNMKSVRDAVAMTILGEVETYDDHVWVMRPQPAGTSVGMGGG